MNSLISANKNNLKKEKRKIFDFHSYKDLYLVIFKTPIPNMNDSPGEQINSIILKANSINDSLEKFSHYANSEMLTTFDIYSVNLYNILLEYFMKNNRGKKDGIQIQQLTSQSLRNV